MGGIANPTITPQLLQRLQTMLSDPIAGPKLMQILNNPNTSAGSASPGVASDLAAVGNAIGKQSTPSGQLGAGIGSIAGLGLRALLNKKPPIAPPESYAPPADAVDAETPIEEDSHGGKVGRKRKFRAGGEAELEAPPLKKRGVLVKRPIFSTTIVIAKKPPGKKAKAEKKARGGPIKPKAVPPRSGPGNGSGGPSSRNGSHNGWPPTPYAKGGHVQVPRGSGIAQRGKKFSGIF